MTNDYKTLLELIQTIRILRGQNGCPWDKKQTCLTLTKYIKEESDELVQAILNNDSNNIREEIGDLLYLLIMISEINMAQGKFEFADALIAINAKLIRRHPHVFAGQTYNNEQELIDQWQAIKAEEKKKNIV